MFSQYPAQEAPAPGSIISPYQGLIWINKCNNKLFDNESEVLYAAHEMADFVYRIVDGPSQIHDICMWTKEQLDQHLAKCKEIRNDCIWYIVKLNSPNFGVKYITEYVPKPIDHYVTVERLTEATAELDDYVEYIVGTYDR